MLKRVFFFQTGYRKTIYFISWRNILQMSWKLLNCHSIEINDTSDPATIFIIFDFDSIQIHCRSMLIKSRENNSWHWQKLLPCSHTALRYIYSWCLPTEALHHYAWKNPMEVIRTKPNMHGIGLFSNNCCQDNLFSSLVWLTWLYLFVYKCNIVQYLEYR